MQESLELETAEGLKTDEMSLFLSKVAFDFLVCSLKKTKNKKLSLGSRGWECGKVKASTCFSVQEKQLTMVKHFGVVYIGQALMPICFKTLADIR